MNVGFCVGFGKWQQYTDLAQTFWLLGTRRERPRCRRATQNTEKFPPSHGPFHQLENIIVAALPGSAKGAAPLFRIRRHVMT
jgi:hypothetical protein